MNRILMLLIVAGVAIVLVGTGRGEAAESGGRWTQDRLVKEKWQSWQEALKSSSDEMKEIVRALGLIGLDEERNDGERVHAVLLMAEAGTDDAVDFCLAHITLWIKNIVFLNIGDREKQQACVFALKKMGWRAVPRILEFLKKERSKEELGYVAEVLERTCTKKIASAILEEELRVNRGISASNVKKLLRMLKPETDKTK